MSEEEYSEGGSGGNWLIRILIGFCSILAVVAFLPGIDAAYGNDVSKAISFITQNGYTVYANGDLPGSALVGISDNQTLSNKTYQGGSVSGNFVPTTNNTRTLGNSDRWFNYVWTNTVRAINGIFDTVNVTQLTATTGNVTTAFITSGNITSANVGSVNTSNIYHTDLYGQTYKLFASGGVPTGFGYVSAFYFGQNVGNPTSNASFQGAFGIGCLNGTDNLSEGNWAFGDAIFQGTNLRYNNGIGDGTGRWMSNSTGANLIGDHIFYQEPSTVNWSSILGGQSFFYTRSSVGDAAIGYQTGYNNGVAGGVSSYNIFLGHQAGYYEINSTNKLYINNGQGGSDNRSSYVYGNMQPRIRTFELGEAPATAGILTQNGQRFTLNAYYWNGSASATWNATIQHLMSATTPDSYLNFTINSVSGLKIRNNNGTMTVNTTGILTNDTRIDAPSFRMTTGTFTFVNDALAIQTEATADMGSPVFMAWNGTARVEVMRMQGALTPYMQFTRAPKFSQNGTPSDNTTIAAWVKIINGDGQMMYLPAYK